MFNFGVLKYNLKSPTKNVGHVSNDQRKLDL